MNNAEFIQIYEEEIDEVAMKNLEFRTAYILPLYVPSKKLRYDIKTLNETKLVRSFTVDRKGT